MAITDAASGDQLDPETRQPEENEEELHDEWGIADQFHVCADHPLDRSGALTSRPRACNARGEAKHRRDRRQVDRDQQALQEQGPLVENGEEVELDRQLRPDMENVGYFGRSPAGRPSHFSDSLSRSPALLGLGDDFIQLGAQSVLALGHADEVRRVLEDELVLGAQLRIAR